jgi:hypothetical protein
LTQGSAPVTAPSAATALANSSNPNAVPQVQNALTSGLSQQLTNAGVSFPGPSLATFVQTTLSGALNSGFSVTDLKGSLTAGLLPGVGGLPVAMLGGIVASSVDSAFGSVGVGLTSLTRLGVNALQAAPVPGGLGVLSPALTLPQ